MHKLKQSFLKMSELFKAHLSLFLVNTMYAASYLFAKGVMPKYLSPTVFISFRALGAATLFWILRISIAYEKIAKGDWFRLVLCGLFGVAINQLFIYNGLALTTSINAGIIMTSNPIFVFVLSLLFLHERLSLFAALGIFIGLSGAVLLILSDGQLGGGAFKGNLFIIFNSFSYAVYLILSKPLMKKYRHITVVTWVFTFGAMFVLCVPNLYSEFFATQFSTFPMHIVLKILFIIIGVTFLTYLLTLYSVKILGPTISSSYIYIQPMMVLVLSYLFVMLNISDDYTKSITLEKFAYMFLIVLGVSLISLKKKKVSL